MGALTPLQQLAQPVDMTGWPEQDLNAMGIPTPIAPARPLSSIGTSAAATPDINATGRAGALGIDTSNPSVYSPSPAGGYSSKLTDWIHANLEDMVFIVVGLILVAAAVFSFKETQTVIKTAARTAAQVAA